MLTYANLFFCSWFVTGENDKYLLWTLKVSVLWVSNYVYESVISLLWVLLCTFTVGMFNG